MLLTLVNIEWIVLYAGLCVSNVCVGSLQECKDSDEVSFHMAARIGFKFELPLCCQRRDYNHLHGNINNKYTKFNKNETNVWVATKENFTDCVNDKVIVFMITRVGYNDHMIHTVKFHPYGQWITINVNLTKVAVTESTISESSILHSTVTQPVITQSTLPPFPTSTVQQSTSIVTVCESGWQYIGKRCLKLFNGTKWTEAKRTCEEAGANLTDGRFDRSMYKLDKKPDNTQTWILKKNGSHCSFLKKDNNEAKSINCTESRNFFCEKLPVQPNITSFNLQAHLQGGHIDKHDLINPYISQITISKNASSLRFVCNGSGQTIVTILRDNEILASGINSVTYEQNTSQKVQCLDSGEYSCVTENDSRVSKVAKKIQGTCNLRIETFSSSAKRENDIFVAEINQSDVTVQCRTNRVIDPFLKILHNGKSLVDNQTTYANYRIPLMQCRDMGDYICRAENIGTKEYEEQTIQLAVSNCQAQLCSDSGQQKTIKAKVYTNITISICMKIYQETLQKVKLYLKDTIIEQTQGNRYMWWLVTIRQLNKTVNLNILSIEPEDFGVQYLSVEFNGYNTSILLDIQSEGPPLCPTNLTIHEIGTRDVRLSWTPGFNGGAEQTFSIIYTKLNGIAQQTLVSNITVTVPHDVTIKNLDSNTTYEFRVTSSNRFGQQIEVSNSCNVAITGSTLTENIPESKGDLRIVAIVVAGVALVVIIVGLAAIVMKKRGSRIRQGKLRKADLNRNEYNELECSQLESAETYANMTTPSEQGGPDGHHIMASENGEHTLEVDNNYGRYVSDQGLVYVTLAHTQSIKKPPRKVSIKKEVESVEYVTIDYVKTAQQQEEEQNNEETSGDVGNDHGDGVNTSSTSGNMDSGCGGLHSSVITEQTKNIDTNLESCQVDNKEDVKLLLE